MKPAILVALLATLAGCEDPPSATPPDPPPARPASLWPAPERYALDLRYDARRMALSGTQRIAFANPSPRPLKRVWLRVWANAHGGCRRPYAAVRVRDGGRVAHRRRDCTALEVQLEQPVPPGGHGAISLAVRVGVPPRPGRFGRFRGAAYFGNALPLLAVEDRRGPRLPAYAWRGEAFFSLSARWEVRLALPRGITAATTGRLREGLLVAERARDFTIVAGPLRVREATAAGGVRVRHYTHPSRPATEARRVLAAAAAALERFGGWYGPYEAGELDVVDGPADAGRGGIAMEYPELVLAPPVAGAVVHEVAHQWWWGILGSDQHAEPWLDEALAEWSAWRLPRSLGGGPRLGPCRPRPRDLPPLTAPMDVFERAARDAYLRVVYFGGACALQRIAGAVGTARLDAALREVVRERRFGTWTRADFVAAVRAAAPEGTRIDALLRSEGLPG